jgi:hypothetical protein
MTSSSNCPVDLMLIIENRTRVVALMAGLLTVSFLLTLNILIPTFLASFLGLFMSCYIIEFYYKIFNSSKSIH